MTTFATHEGSELTELEERVRRAWGSYRENLVDLDGIAYDQAERAEWEHLQTDLRAIAAERAAAKAARAGDAAVATPTAETPAAEAPTAEAPAAGAPSAKRPAA